MAGRATADKVHTPTFKKKFTHLHPTTTMTPPTPWPCPLTRRAITRYAPPFLILLLIPTDNAPAPPQQWQQQWPAVAPPTPPPTTTSTTSMTDNAPPPPPDCPTPYHGTHKTKPSWLSFQLVPICKSLLPFSYYHLLICSPKLPSFNLSSFLPLHHFLSIIIIILYIIIKY